MSLKVSDTRCTRHVTIIGSVIRTSSHWQHKCGKKHPP